MIVGVDGRNLIRPMAGIGRYVATSSSALAEKGISVALFLPEPMHADFEALSRHPNITVQAWRGKGLVQRLYWARNVLPKAVNAMRPDVFWGPAHRLPSGLDRSIRSVLTIHDLVWKEAPETMLWYRRLGERLQMPAALRRADRIIADSKHTIELLGRHFSIDRQRMQLAYPGVAPLPAPLDEDALRPLGIDGPYCLFVGTLEPRKNLTRAVRAYLSLPSELKGKCSFVIAGEQGWHAAELAEILNANRRHIVATGRIDDRMIATLYAHCSFLVMPSLYEGFGFPVIEAQSFGKAVLTSRGSSMEEIGGDTLSLVNPLDTDEIANAMARLITSEFTQDQRVRARRNATRFSPQAAIGNLVDALANVRSDGPSR